MKTKCGFLRTAWAKFTRANQLPPGNQARSWAVYPRTLLPCVTTLLLAQAALTQTLRTGADGSSPPASAPAGGENGEQKLEAARAALHGPRKDTAKAKKLLLEVLEQDKATLQPGSLCYVYVYLGYIEDRATNRTQAIAWYKQALALKEGDGVRECAQLGLKEPMTWIRHLDADAGPARQTGSSISPTNAAASNPRLKTKVKFTANQASVQDIVQALALQAGLGYERQKSFSQTDPLCRRWVNNAAIEGKSCGEALDQILQPVGLRYQVEDGAIVLYRKDEGSAPSASANPAVKTLDLGKAYVTTEQPPAGLVPARALSPEERQVNFDLLWEAIDKTYACFELKSINWPEVRLRYQAQLDQAATADAFYLLLFQLVNELKDTHSWLQNYRPPRPAHGPGLSAELFDGRPFLVAVETNSEAAGMGVKPGMEIVEVDGATVEERLARLRPYLPGCSSERRVPARGLPLSPGRRERQHGDREVALPRRSNERDACAQAEFWVGSPG